MKQDCLQMSASKNYRKMNGLPSKSSCFSAATNTRLQAERPFHTRETHEPNFEQQDAQGVGYSPGLQDMNSAMARSCNRGSFISHPTPLTLVESSTNPPEIPHTRDTHTHYKESLIHPAHDSPSHVSHNLSSPLCGTVETNGATAIQTSPASHDPNHRNLNQTHARKIANCTSYSRSMQAIVVQLMQNNSTGKSDKPEPSSGLLS